MNEDEKIKELEKKVEELSYIHGICDKFGTYQSLKKDAEIINFFLANPEHKRRYIELINEFKYKGWAKSTIEKHLSGLTKKRILCRTHLPGEYELAYDMSQDADLLVEYLIGNSLCRLAMKSWGKKYHHF